MPTRRLWWKLALSRDNRQARGRRFRDEALIDGRTYPYDYLVLASGASHSYFGHDESAPNAPGLKRIEDATEVRRRLLLAFERAALMTSLIVGGGVTGVNLAGAIADLAHLGMEQDFRRIDPRDAPVIVVQSAPRILSTFPSCVSHLVFPTNGLICKSDVHRSPVHISDLLEFPSVPEFRGISFADSRRGEVQINMS